MYSSILPSLCPTVYISNLPYARFISWHCPFKPVTSVGRLWHSHEFRGFENIPSRGGAMVVWYHGTIPVDYLGLIAEIQLKHGRVMKSVVDRYSLD